MEAGDGPHPILLPGCGTWFSDGELGGSGSNSEHPPDVLQHLHGQDPTCSGKGKEAQGGYGGLDEELEFRLLTGWGGTPARTTTKVVLGGRPARMMGAPGRSGQGATAESARTQEPMVLQDLEMD